MKHRRLVGIVLASSLLCGCKKTTPPASDSTDASAPSPNAANVPPASALSSADPRPIPRVGPKHNATVRSEAPTISGQLAPDVVQRVVRGKSGAYRQCYEQGLVANPDLRGRVAIKFVVDASGAVEKAEDAGSDLGDATVISCVAQTLRSLKFPQPEGGPVTVVYPFVFKTES